MFRSQGSKKVNVSGGSDALGEVLEILKSENNTQVATVKMVHRQEPVSEFKEFYLVSNPQDKKRLYVAPTDFYQVYMMDPVEHSFNCSFPVELSDVDMELVNVRDDPEKAESYRNLGFSTKSLHVAEKEAKAKLVNQ